MANIQLSKAVLQGVNDLTLILIKSMKDGIQVTDLPVILTEMLSDEVIKTTMGILFSRMKEFNEEIKDLDMAEITELIVMEAMFVPTLIAALKKPV